MQRYRIWFAFLGGALAWALHLLATYFMSETACRSVLDSGAQVPLLIALGVLTGLCLMITAWAFHTGYRLAQIPSDTSGGIDFVGKTSLWANGLFLLVILAQTLPLFMGVAGC